MRSVWGVLGAALGWGALAIPAAAWAELVDRVAAVVNNDIITLSEVEARGAPELARLASEPDPAKRTKYRQQIMKNAMDSLISEHLLDAQLKDLNVDVSESDIDAALDDVKKQNNVTDEAQLEQLLRTSPEGYTLKSYREFLRKHVAKLKLINLKVRSKVKVSDEDLKAEYTRFARLESEDPEIHARHILIQVGPRATPEEVERAQRKAEEIAKEARQPGVDFVALATKYSEGSSRESGGDLGYFRRGLMVPEFEKVAFALKLGEVSDPVRSRFGWHVIRVEDRRAAAVRPFDEVKDQLRDKLMRGQLEKYTERYVQELREQASIDVKL